MAAGCLTYNRSFPRTPRNVRELTRRLSPRYEFGSAPFVRAWPGGSMSSSRRKGLRWLILISLLSLPVAAETTVPISLQVELLKKVVRFERGFTGRTGDHVTLLVIRKAGNAESERATTQLLAAFSATNDFAGKPPTATALDYSTPAALKAAIGSSGAQLVYLTTGLSADMAPIATALEGVTAITVSTDGDQVDQGAVLGFELVSSKPKIAINLAQARRQGLDFSSDLFRVARVVRLD